MKLMKLFQSTIISMIILSMFIISSIIPISALDINENQKSITINSNEIDTKISLILGMINEEVVGGFLRSLLDFSPRMTDTDGCREAANYIFNQFNAMNLDARFQNWTSFGNIYNPRVFQSQNVEGTLKGADKTSDKIIIFNAHYDTVKDTPGANDDGSGTTAVLTAAYILSHFEFKHTIKFVTFSGEEIGLLGSQEYAREAYDRNDNILLDINADMIGYAKTTEGGRRMGISLSEDANWISDIIDELNTDYNIDFDIGYGGIDRDGRGYSDYFSFIEYGYEAIACWGGEGDPNMHKPTDDFDNVNLSYLVNTTRIIVATIAILADSDEFFPQVQIEYPKNGRIYHKQRLIRKIRDLNTYVIGDTLIMASLKHSSTPIKYVEFYIDDVLLYNDSEPTFRWEFNERSMRKHRITVKICDELGRKSTDWKNIYFFNLFKKL